ncbi:glycosyl transferase GT-A type structural fold protein [Metarhizium robertsii]|uniref:Glucans biosynthesis glucosyltransferase H n=2 Tax=Metarhizium robertsii TaxID=568076 RepID=E9F868_METRA|nr:glucans biosynthesis glucosyltransferase H [Metarhizium robertsii ARSEF 23]EFY96160.1 glucans biosynthesis glucosyltransferase H [Metarhizium robertsii ARSEF 23]EXU98309.1 glycosyl transferase GT-A type structural fold protein [Metarhizium robertsii]
MEKHPRIGRLQTQFAGMPAAGSFTRLLQFGMLHNVPVHNVGILKFCWTHNAITRIGAFRRHRMLPVQTESSETNPPTLLGILRREHRWYQGIMRYCFLLKEPGLQSVSRFQVCQILASFLGSASGVLWMLAASPRHVGWI